MKILQLYWILCHAGYIVYNKKRYESPLILKSVDDKFPGGSRHITVTLLEDEVNSSYDEVKISVKICNAKNTEHVNLDHLRKDVCHLYETNKNVDDRIRETILIKKRKGYYIETIIRFHDSIHPDNFLVNMIEELSSYLIEISKFLSNNKPSENNKLPMKSKG